MQLTDPSLIVLLALLALAAFVLLVAGWPRWRRKSMQVVTRAVQAITVNVLVIALCGVLLNNQYLFYSSWGDLVASGSPSVTQHHGGGAAAVVSARVKGPGLSGIQTPAALPPLAQPGSRMQDYTAVGARSKSRGQVLVYLPVGYDPRSSHAYPVIMGLHGYPSAPKGFVRLNFLSAIDSLTAQHKMTPTIVVIPRIDTPATLDTECVNGGQGQPQTDTWLSNDIPAWAAAHFHIQTKRTSWAAVGYSYGAWCAASITMRHPDVFGAAISMTGYFRPRFSHGYNPLTRATRGGYDLVALAHQNPPPVALWVLASREDHGSFPTTDA
ncbi:MAG: alpha/beta hydrolase-fold protein, partial [Terracoccus sp.]